MCLSGIAHFLLSNMRSRGGHSDGVRKQAVCTLLGEGEGEQERKARIRHIMNELGTKGLELGILSLGCRAHTPGKSPDGH